MPQCEHCDKVAPESDDEQIEEWHMDDAGLLLCDDCYEIHFDHLADELAGGYYR